MEVANEDDGNDDGQQNEEENADVDGEENGEGNTEENGDENADANEENRDENEENGDEIDEQNGEEEQTLIASESQSPRVDERIDSAANREILIIDHGDNEEQNMNDLEEDAALDNEAEPEQPPEENDHHITEIETSEIENFNEIDDIPDLDYEEEMPLQESVRASSAVSRKSSAGKSARSNRSAMSIENVDDAQQSKPASAFPASTKSVRSNQCC